MNQFFNSSRFVQKFTTSYGRPQSTFVIYTYHTNRMGGGFMADFDFSKLKDNVGGLVDNLKSMINPTGGTPQVDPDDALGVKIAQISTLIKQLSDAQQEQVKQFKQLNELVNAAFQDIEALRHDVKAKKAEKPTE